MTQAIGTVAYLPPEYLMSSDAANGSGTGAVNGMHWDTYSFAILLAFLFTERPPYHQLHNEEICIQVCHHKRRPPLVVETDSAEPLPPELSEMVQQMWAHAGDERPALCDVLS